jgi:hypothetical protein
MFGYDPTTLQAIVFHTTRRPTMTARSLLVVAILLVAAPAHAERKTYPKAKVNFDDFKALVAEAEPHRARRLVDLDTFLKMSREPGVVVLDTRSAMRYERIHLAGATNLSFPDFTQANLRKIIPSEETTVLIYCNNNFDGDEVNFASKVFIPAARLAPAGPAAPAAPATPATQIAAQERPVMLALNVPTYVTLYGYGYRNVYELDELVKVSDPRVTFEGTVVAPKK